MALSVSAERLIEYDPLVTATDAPEGTILIDQDGTRWRKMDNGSSTFVTRVVNNQVVVNTAGSGSPNLILPENSGDFYSNEGSGAMNHHTLPAAAVSLEYKFFVQNANGMRILAQPGDTINTGSGVSAAGGYIESTFQGSFAHLRSVNGTEWVAVTTGEWNIDGVPAAGQNIGEYYFSTPAATVLSAATPAKAAGTTTAILTSGFTHSNNRLTHTGLATKNFFVSASISVTKASGGAALGSFYIAKNGTEIAGSVISRTLANTADEGAVPIQVTTLLATGDYVEVFVESDNGDDITVQSGVVNVIPAGV